MGSLEKIKRDIDEWEDMLADAKSQKERLEGRREMLIKQLRELGATVKTAPGKIDKLEKEMEILTDKIYSLHEEITARMDKIGGN